MSLYGQYIKEREDYEILEDSEGFCTYKILDNGECYIRDIYVIPELRRSNKAESMANKVAEIAIREGCKLLVGSVCTISKDPTTSLKVLLAYGMKFHSIQDNMIYLIKEL